MKVKLPDGTIITGADQGAVLAQLAVLGIVDVVLVTPAVKGTTVLVIEK